MVLEVRHKIVILVVLVKKSREYNISTYVSIYYCIKSQKCSNIIPVQFAETIIDKHLKNLPKCENYSLEVV